MHRAHVLVACLGLPVLAFGGAVSCGAPAAPPSATNASTPSAVSAQSPVFDATPATSAVVASPPASASSLSPYSIVSDPASFACGATRCAKGRETCCRLGMGGSTTKCVTATNPASEAVMKKSCFTDCELPAQDCEPSFESFARCDGSQDCAADEACCQTTRELLDKSAIFQRCVSVRVSTSKTLQPTCADGDEACVVGGPSCRTPGAECVFGLCKRPASDPSHVCEVASDCLVGQRCIHRDGPPECLGYVPLQVCERTQDCQTFCADQRARCALHKERMGRAPGPPQKICDCP